MILTETLNAIKTRTAFGFLALMMGALVFAFTGWTTLSTNFATQAVGMSGDQWGIAQSIREIPGFLAFTTVFLLFLFSEQRLAIYSVIILGLGVVFTGFFPHAMGFYVTTFMMSVGFHYFYTIFLSLPMQIFTVDEYPLQRAKLKSIDSAIAAFSFSMIYIAVSFLHLDFYMLFLIAGLPVIFVGLWCLKKFPPFKLDHPQTMRIFLRSNYALYYLLQFLSGARRQIFVVFASLLLVQRFEYDVQSIALLFLINHLIMTFIAPFIGRMIKGYGERFILQIEYIGLLMVYLLYTFVDDALFAAMLYVVNNLFFSMAIALEGYFKRIAQPDEIAASAGTVFTINHIAAVFLPVFLGMVWLLRPDIVFYIGAFLAFSSFVAASLIPRYPSQDHVIRSFGLRFT